MERRKTRGPSSQPAVLYVALRDESYPRNRRLRDFLTESGFLVDVVGLPPGATYWTQLAATLRGCRRIARDRHYDIVLLAEFSLTLFPVAWITARLTRALLITDWFVGLEETRIEDHGNVRGNSPKGTIFKLLDRLSARHSDYLLTDTDVRSAWLQRKYNLRQAPMTAPVGAPAWATRSPQSGARAETPLRILYYGNYVPLHGLSLFLEGFELYLRTAVAEMVLIGDGPRRAEVEARVKALEIGGRCKFVDVVTEEDLAEHISNADVVLGVFGASPKASSVIANKVWQALSMGAVVITRHSEALDEIRDIAGVALVEVTRISAEAVCESLREAELRSRTTLRADIGPALENYVRDRFTEIETRLAAALGQR